MHFRKMHRSPARRAAHQDLPAVRRVAGGAPQPLAAGAEPAPRAGPRSRLGLGLGVIRVRVSKISRILQIFGRLVLGCIKTKFCKKICV